MTTKLIIENAACSNGDVHIGGMSPSPITLLPGQKTENWVSTGHDITVKETWPTTKPASPLEIASAKADDLIAMEVSVQDAMWGDANERADSANNQLFDAATAQLVVTKLLLGGATPEAAVEEGLGFYPKGWEGLRSYGSTVANLAVAAAFIRSEMKRRIMAGEDTTRTKRGEPYKTAKPYVSSEDAIAHYPV